MTAAAQVDAPAWLTDFYANVDELDVEAVLAGFAPDATMRFGAGDTMPGHDAIRGGLGYLFTQYLGITHRFLNVWDTGSTVLVEADVTYRTQDERVVTVPALTVIDHRDGGVITGMRIFIDMAPVEAG